MQFERADEGSRLKILPEEKRKANILQYIKEHNTISSSFCRELNNCSKYLVMKDLAELQQAGKIIRLGTRTNAQYGLVAEE